MEEEFGQFVAARGRSLCRTAYLLTGDWQVGEDLVQEALVRTCLRRRRLRSQDTLEPYARKVLLSLFLSARRRRWHGEVPHAQLPDRAARSEVDTVIDRHAQWPAPDAAVLAAACTRTRRAGQRTAGPRRQQRDWSAGSTARGCGGG